MPVVQPAVTRFSKTLVESRLRTIGLYRDWQKAVPEIVRDYRISFPSSIVRQKIRAEFEKNRSLTDIGAINIALFKGRAEYEETINCWKQINHVLNYFDDAMKPPPQKVTDANFVERFFSGQN
ncbi:hypothetical protein BB561_000473 [Smittium simulii]|uniref:Complex 1 LYR protein domain-containing protein n=1 Tax=Smittium simulii TaxID=133385 RepID=A0A2T9YZ12_9FUNG|nr:hypothetical protein BB561_000473 [Smittium simulii]